MVAARAVCSAQSCRRRHGCLWAKVANGLRHNILLAALVQHAGMSWSWHHTVPMQRHFFMHPVFSPGCCSIQQLIIAAQDVPASELRFCSDSLFTSSCGTRGSCSSAVQHDINIDVDMIYAGQAWNLCVRGLWLSQGCPGYAGVHRAGTGGGDRNAVPVWRRPQCCYGALVSLSVSCACVHGLAWCSMFMPRVLAACIPLKPPVGWVCRVWWWCSLSWFLFV